MAMNKTELIETVSANSEFNAGSKAEAERAINAVIDGSKAGLKGDKKGVQVLLAPSLDLARGISPTVSVEAEYGAEVVEGSLYTAAHHVAKYKECPAPCNNQEIPKVEEGVILISHLDLDTIGGVWKAMGIDPVDKADAGFWRLAEFADLNGPHRLGDFIPDFEAHKEWLYSFWAWKEGKVAGYDGLPRFPRDKVTDVTSLVREAAEIFCYIQGGAPLFKEAGLADQKAQQEAKERTFVQLQGAVGVYVGDVFMNGFYDTPEGMAKALVCFSTKFKSITISLERPIEGLSCRWQVQDLWGPEAGGHEGIAGSPRGKEMTLQDLVEAANRMDTQVRVWGGRQIAPVGCSCGQEDTQVCSTCGVCHCGSLCPASPSERMGKLVGQLEGWRRGVVLATDADEAALESCLDTMKDLSMGLEGRAEKLLVTQLYEEMAEYVCRELTRTKEEGRLSEWSMDGLQAIFLEVVWVYQTVLEGTKT